MLPVVCARQNPIRNCTRLHLRWGPAMRISIAVADENRRSQWQDVSFADAMIHVRRTWTCGQVGLPKSNASKGPVPLHPLLAEFMLLCKQKTPYSQSWDWVFSSSRLEGKQPRMANMLVEDHLRPDCSEGWHSFVTQELARTARRRQPTTIRFSQSSPQSRVLSDPHQNRS